MFIKSIQKKTIDYIFEDNTKVSFCTELAALVNKFKSVFSIVNAMLDSNNTLKDTYEKFLREYFDSLTDDDRYSVFLKYYRQLFELIDQTYNNLNLGKSLKVNVKDEYCLNINYEETETIFKSSIRTRFFVICYMSEYSVDQIKQKEIHKLICKDLIDSGVLKKLYKIINSIVLNTNPTKSGKKIWDLLSTSTGYTAEGYSIKLLSSVIYKALPSLNPNENPVAFMISIAKNEMDWLLRTKLGTKIVNSEINISNVTEATNRIEEHEIYYRTIVQQYFKPVAYTYSSICEKLSRYNLYTTASTICSPLINKIFSVGINKILLDNVSLINMFCYDFFIKYDKDKSEILKILKLVPITSKIVSTERLLPEDIKAHIKNVSIVKGLNKRITYLTPVNLQKVLTESIGKLYNCTYCDYVNMEEVTVNWYEFVNEYIDYLTNILDGTYDSYILEIKNNILIKRKEDLDVFTH